MGRSNDVYGMFVFSANMNGKLIRSNTVLWSASLPAIAYNAYFMPKRYATVSENVITVLDPDEWVHFGLLHV